jgi:hypothetical protein
MYFRNTTFVIHEELDFADDAERIRIIFSRMTGIDLGLFPGEDGKRRRHLSSAYGGA